MANFMVNLNSKITAYGRAKSFDVFSDLAQKMDMSVYIFFRLLYLTDMIIKNAGHVLEK